MPILHPVQAPVLLAGVLVLPVLVNGVRQPGQPGTVFCHFQNISRCKKLCAVLGRVAQWFKQPGSDERRYVVGLAVQHPPGLLRRQPGGQLPQDRQESKLVVIHTVSVESQA